MRVEARARLAAEAGLKKRFNKEYEKLLKDKGPIGALVALVTGHSREYGAMVAEARDRIRAKARDDEAAA
jgi:hypothetical protein